MPTTPFLPSPDNVGDEYTTCSFTLGGANRLLGATPFTSGGSTDVPIPTAAAFASLKNAVIVCAGTVAAGTGTCNATIRKRQVGGAFVTVSTTLDLFGRAQWDHLSFRQASGTTDRDVSCAAGESFVLTVVNTGGTITTQPVDLLVTVRYAIRR